MCTVSIDDADQLIELLSMIVNLHVGRALVFAPSVIVGRTVSNDKNSNRRYVRLGHRILRFQIRDRVTEDGRQTVLLLFTRCQRSLVKGAPALEVWV